MEENKVNKSILVLSGGGIKGISFLGAMQFLEEKDYLKNFNTFAGTSVGSIIISLYLIGFSPQELFNFIKLFDFTKLKNINVIGMFSTFGFDDGVKIEFLLKKFIISKNHNENITLKQLFEKTNKKLILTTVCINTKKIEYLSHENYPDLPLYLAIRMSISLPWIFKPVLYNGNYYIDGGVMDNYPIRLFDKEIEKVFGILIDSSNLEEKYIENIEAFTISVMQCFLKGMNDFSKIGYDDYTLTLEVNNIHLVQFDIDVDMKNEIYQIGYKTIEDNAEKFNFS